MKKKLQILIMFCLFALSGGAQILYSEDFSSQALPVGWTNDSLGQPAMNSWLFNNPYSRVITGAGFDANFAIFDSDEGSVNDLIDEVGQLTTGDINISTATVSLFLDLDEQYRALAGPNTMGSQRLIEYSTDAGTTWSTIAFDSLDYGYPNPAVHSEFDITTLLGQTNVRFRFNWVGSWDWWWAIDNIQVISRQNCTAPPVAGTTVSSMMFVCSFDSIQLSLTGNDVGLGLTYQWQSSPDGITWTDIAGSTQLIALVAQSTATYYQCNVTCSGITSSSVPVFIDMNASTSCYCIPVYTIGCDALNKVEINTLFNDSTQCNGNANNYINYPDTGTATTSLIQNGTYNLIIASGLGSGNHGAGVWFDFNHDGNFQGVDEYYHISDSIPESSSDFVTPITIPLSAPIGITRMRVRYIYNSAVTQSNDCSSAGYGETEDYSVTISPFVGIQKNNFYGVKIYPTPATDFLNFSFGDMNGRSTIILSDILGNKLKSFDVDNAVFHQLNVGDLANGVYVVRIETIKGAYTQRVVLSR